MNAKTHFNHSLLRWTLGLTYVGTGILSVLPGASLILLARNTHVSLEVAGGMFTISAAGFMFGAILGGTFTRSVKPKYLLTLGLLLLGVGSLTTPLTDSFPLLLVGQILKGFGFGFVDIALNTIATMAFEESLSEELNNIHAMYGLGALLGPAILAVGLQFFHYLALAYLVGIGVVIVTVVLLLGQRVPELPRTLKSKNREKETSAAELRKIMRQSLLWLMVLQIGLYASAEIGFGNWIVTAVSQSAGISLVLAAPVATAFFIGLTAGRLGGAQLLRRGWLSETRLLYVGLLGGALCGVPAALFPGQLWIVYSASALVGCFYGPLFPSIMAITSRRFVHAIGPVSSIMMIGTGACGMIIPAAMGLLIPVLGINWVIAIPAVFCGIVIIPMALANRVQRTTLQAPDEQHTIERVAEGARAGTRAARTMDGDGKLLKLSS